MSSPIHNLQAQLKSDQSRTLTEIAARGYNALNSKKVAHWLCEWIGQGNFNERLEVAQNLLGSSSKNAFWAQMNIEAEAVDGINVELATLTQQRTDAYKAIYASGAAIFMGEQPNALASLKQSLTLSAPSVTRSGIAEDQKAACNGEMLLKLSELYQEAKKEVLANSANFKEGTKILQEGVLTQAINAKIKQHASQFSSEFIKHMKGQVTEQHANSKEFHAPMINANRHNRLIDTLTTTSQDGKSVSPFVSMDNDALQTIVQEAIQAGKDPRAEAQTFIKAYCNAQIFDYDKTEVQKSMLADFQSLKPGAQAYVVLKAKEAKDVQTMQKSDHGSISEFLDKIGIGNLISTGVLGYLAGMVFGSPMMGILVTGLISFIGSADGQVQVGTDEMDSAEQRKKPPVSKGEPADSTAVPA